MLTEGQINFLNRICKGAWTECNGIISVENNFDVSYNNLIKFPIQFGNIEGNFNCDSNLLTTLEGGPKKTKGYYTCELNRLSNLIGAPEIVNAAFFCEYNQLTSLEGCPKIIKGSLWCINNPNLHILYGIGRVLGGVQYDNINDLNEWIIQQTERNIFVTYSDITKWIKDNNKLENLLNAPQEIRQHFSPRILHLADSGVYNESKILDYKKFSRIC